MQNSIRPVPAPRELSIFGAMWRYRWVVVITVLATVLVAVVYDVTRSQPYVAKASLILQPPAASGSSSSLGAQEAARYAQDQLTILRSPALVQQALATTKKRFPVADVTKSDFRNADLTSSADSNVITIGFSASDPRVAATAANAIGESYSGVRQAQVAAGSATALRRIDRAVGDINQRLSQISTELAGLQSEPADDARVTALSQEQKSLLDERASLLQSRSQLNTASDASTQVAIFIPVDRPTQANSDLPRLIAVAIFVGLLLGAGIAYALALRRRRFADGAEIEMVVQAPMLGEIPQLASSRTSGLTPIAAVGTPAAESFRLIASAIATRAELATGKVLLVVSAVRNDGKTTVVANVAIAAAREGGRVLGVDADPHGHGLTRLFESVADGSLGEAGGSRSGDFLPNRGTTVSVGVGPELLDRTPVRVVVTPTATLHLLSMDRSPLENPWRSDPVRKFFQLAREAYDFVLIDTPDLLTASDAAAVAVHADGAIVVVPEHSGVAEVTEVVSRLRLVGVAPIGYIYNAAPRTARRSHRRRAE